MDKPKNENTCRPNASFSERLPALAIWAAIRASRARELSLEWQALGFALGAAYLLFVVVPSTTFTLLDVFVLILTAGGGIALSRFELRSRSVLLQLSERLQEEADVAADDSKTSRAD